MRQKAGWSGDGGKRAETRAEAGSQVGGAEYFQGEIAGDIS